VKRSACACLFAALFVLAVQSVRAEVIFFDDSHADFMVPPATTRWTPGHDGGICSASTAGPGMLCAPESFSEEAVWGYLAPPPSQVPLTLDTDPNDYDALHPAIPFNDILWVTEQRNAPSDLYSDYLYSFTFNSAIYLQFNSAFPAGFHCTDVLVPTDCGHPHTIAETNGVVTAGYIRWSDGSFDQITFMSIEAIPEPSSVLLLAVGLLLLFWRYRKTQPRLA
jgi:hypothetical protein